MSLDLRPSFPSVLRRAQQVLAAHHEASRGGVSVLWQHVGETVEEFDVRVDQARRVLPATRLLLVVCTHVWV